MKGLKQFIGNHKSLNLMGDDPFQGFCKKGKVGNRAIVVEYVSVQARFFEDRGDSSCFVY